MLNARLTRRFPLMPLAWIPAYAAMTLVEGRYRLVRQHSRCDTI